MTALALIEKQQAMVKKVRDPGLNFYEKARRWSTDVIATRTFWNVKRLSTPAVNLELQQLPGKSFGLLEGSKQFKFLKSGQEVVHVVYLLLDDGLYKYVLELLDVDDHVNLMVTNILTTDPHVQVCRLITPASKNAVKWELDWSRRLKGKQEWKQIKKAKSESTLSSDLKEEEYENIPEVLIQELIYWREMYTTCQCFKQALGCSKNNVVLMMTMESITSRCASLIQMYLVTIETWNSNCLLLGLVIFNSVWKSQECFELLSHVFHQNTADGSLLATFRRPDVTGGVTLEEIVSMLRYQSAPTLLAVGDNTYVVTGLNPEFGDDDGSDGDESVYSVKVVEANKPSLDVSPGQQEVTLRKKRQAPLPPLTSTAEPTKQLLRSINSTDSSDNQLAWSPNTSTESDSLPALSRSSLQLSDSDQNTLTPQKERSRFHKFRYALRSPQIGRSRSKKEKREFSRSMTIRSIAEDESSVKRRNNASDSEKSSPKFRQGEAMDPVITMSKWIIAVGCDDVETEQDFEITKVSDYGKFLEDLVQEPERTPEECDFLSQIIRRVRAMVIDNNASLISSSTLTSEIDVTTGNDVDDRSMDDSVSRGSDIIHESNVDNREDSNSYRSDTSSLDVRSNDISVVIEMDHSPSNSSFSSAVLFKPPAGSRWSTSGIPQKSDFQLIKTSRDFSRLLVKETSVRLAAGMQTQERYLFLLSDLLLVAKCKTNTVFKLKYKVSLRDLWLAAGNDEVFESSTPAERSFVLGWPTTNYVAIFPSEEVKGDWFKVLSERMTEEKSKDSNVCVPLTVVSRDLLKKTCEITITNTTTANSVLQACLEQMDYDPNEVQNFQLWVRSGKDGSPYPLFGHETPFSIKFNLLHETSKTKSRDDRLRTSTSAAFIAEENPKCEFFIKQKKSQKKFLENTFQKSMKKTRRSTNFINNFLKRLRPAQPSVFGQALDNICDENHNPPDAIIKLMIWIYQYGPSKVGILRRGNNASIGKELREKIDNGIAFELDDSLTPTAASVFKEFIRHIPEGLMLKELHTEWIKIKIDDPDNEKIQQIKKVLDQLPPAHFNLLKMTMCLLQHLAKHSSFTQMGPSNLATCIAPSFFSHGASEARKSKKEHENLEKTFHEITQFLTPLITFMINKHLEIFGEDVLTMFDKYGCKQSPVVHITEDKSPLHSSQIAEQEEESFDDEDMNNETKLKVQERPGFPDSNSGTDSDSLHSVLSLPTDTRSGIQQDTSSIDSLVDKEDFSNEIESSPTVIKSHLSPTNLSRDSGLTLSDTQLYDEDAGLDFTANFKVIKDSPVFSRALTPRRYYKNKSKERDKGLDSLNRTQKFMNNSSATSSDLTYSLGNDHMLTEDSHNEASFSPNHLYLSSQQHKMLTQTSVDESVSPVSTHASIFSQSEEGSVHSAPQTPDDFHTRSLDWKANDSPNQLEIHESYFSLSNFSKSESNLKMESSEYDQNNEKKVLALKNDKRKVKRNWKSHEAEEVMTRRRYQPRLVLPPREISVDESSPSPSFAEPKTPLKHNIPVDHIKGSPPPNVILQSFHQSSHSNPHEIHKKAVSSSKSLDGVFMKDAIQKKSSFKINAHNFQSGQTPQDMQSVSQHVLGNCREPIEITEYEREKQKEISARAKAIYEDSLQKYYEKSETISSDVLFHVKKGQRPKMVQRDNLKPKDNNVIFDCSVESPSNSLLLKEESDKGSYSTLNQSMSDNPERLTLDSSAHISNTSNENVNLNVKKSPKELYLESIKQIQVTEGIPHNQMKGKLSLQSSLPNVFSKLPPNSSEQCSKPVSSDGPSIFKSIVNDLHRSQSDARDFKVKNQVSEKLNNKTFDENLQDVETEAINRSKEFEITSEDLHQNFLRAKNVFQTVSQQGKAERAYMSPTNPFKSSNERLLSKTSPLIGNYKIETLPPAQNKADANPLTASKFQTIEDPVLNSKHRVIETPLSASRHKSVSTIELSNLRDHDNISKTKAELPWSVKNLKSQWDKGSSKPLFSSNSFKTNSVSASEQNLSSLNSTKIIRDVDNKINPNNVTSASQQNLSSLNSSKIRDINNKINPNIYL